MTLTPCDLALAAMAAPEPESRLTSSSTFAPLVIACSACCCCVDLSPSAFSIVDFTPAASKAFLSSGRSTVSHRTDDLESGSRTPTLPDALSPPPPPEELPPPPPPLLSSPPQPATRPASAIVPTVANTANLRDMGTSLRTILPPRGVLDVLVLVVIVRPHRPRRSVPRRPARTGQWPARGLRARSPGPPALRPPRRGPG